MIMETNIENDNFVHDSNYKRIYIKQNIMSMKKLTTEEKSKRYNEALERAREFYNNEECRVGMTLVDLEVIFPELKESEGERIKKALIDYFDDANKADENPLQSYGIRTDKAIAWLEKQGTPAKLSEEEQNKFANGVLTSCALSFIDYLDAHKYEDKMCVSNGECEDIENAFHNAMWDRLHRYYCKYIEKQGEQKYTKKDVDDAYLKGITDTKNEIEKQYEANYPIRKDIATFIFNYRGDIKDRAKWIDYLGIKVSFVEMQSEQKSDDKVEPKFHEGDWVVVSTTKGDRVVQIASVEYFKDGYPSYITTEGRWFGNGTKARLLTDKDVEIATIPESKVVKSKIKYWSEEDEEMRLGAIKYLELFDAQGIHENKAVPCINWLKSLRPQKQWKPSKEQMEALWNVYEGGEKQSALASLYNDLKKL